MYFVYVLYSEKIKKRYIGSTSDLQKRIEHHNLGLDRWSKRGVPWKLLYSEEYLTRKETLKREKYFKSGIGRELLTELFK